MTHEHIAEQTLADITRREVSLYAAISDFASFYSILDDTNHQYAVVIVPNDKQKRPPIVFVMAQVVDNKVIILEDTDDKPLFDALIAGGVPREQIILAYQGEALPTA